MNLCLLVTSVAWFQPAPPCLKPSERTNAPTYRLFDWAHESQPGRVVATNSPARPDFGTPYPQRSGAVPFGPL